MSQATHRTRFTSKPPQRRKGLAVEVRSPKASDTRAMAAIPMAPRGRPAKPVLAPAQRAGARVQPQAAADGAPSSADRPPALDYRPADGVDAYVRRVAAATPMQIIETERAGVRGTLIKDLAKRMQVPASRFFDVIGVPKATAEKKASAGAMVTGDGGQTALGVVRLLAIAEAIVANSTAEEAKAFDAAMWLGRWIERHQPSLGGRKPADLLDTPTGMGVVARLLGSIESGAYR